MLGSWESEPTNGNWTTWRWEDGKIGYSNIALQTSLKALQEPGHSLSYWRKLLLASLLDMLQPCLHCTTHTSTIQVLLFNQVLNSAFQFLIDWPPLFLLH